MKYTASDVAIAAAHNITPRAAKTWNPTMARTPRVLVPVQLDVLMVRQATGTWADCGMNPPAGGASPVSHRELLKPPFTDLAAPRPVGAYLHWAVPDALTRGEHDVTAAADGQAKTVFPAIPDRWLVVRLSPAQQGGRRGVRAWILQAGDDNPQPIDIDGWTEPGPRKDGKPPMTALGHGDLAWAAYYDNVVNRLAFYDDLHDVPNGPLAYMVCGWYVDPALDPLGDPAIRSLTDFDARMRELQWELAGHSLFEAMASSLDYMQAAERMGLRSQGTRRAGDVGSVIAEIDQATDGGDGLADTYPSDGSWWPKLSLYHGAAVGIGWPGIGWPGNEQGLLGGDEGSPPDPRSINIGLGNTLVEAMAALVARANESPEEARILEAFQLGVLASLEQPDGRAHVDALLHANAFGVIPGESTTEKIWQPATPMTPAPQPVTPTPDPGVFGTPPPPAPSTQRGSTPGVRIPVEVNATSSAYINSQGVRGPGQLADALTTTNPPAAAQPQPGRWVEVRRSKPRLYHPADPVILVQGGQRSFKHGGDGRFTANGSLICRLTATWITEVSTVKAPRSSMRISVRGSDILTRGIENGSVPPECEQLLEEVAMLDPGSAAAAATAATGNGGGAGMATAATAASTTAAAATAEKNLMVEQTAWWASRDSRVDQGPLMAKSGIAGQLPSPVAITPPVRPWNPIHLDWDVEFVPSIDGVDDWHLDEIDFIPDARRIPPPPIAPAAGAATTSIRVKGRTLLTAGAASIMASAVRQALKTATATATASQLAADFTERFSSNMAEALLDAVDAVQRAAAGAAAGAGDAIDRSALEHIAGRLESMDVLSGALDGFHMGLRGGIPGWDGVPPAAGTTIPPGLVELRAGFMRVRQLRLVDGFGQIVNLAGSDAYTIADPGRIVRSDTISVDGMIAYSAMPPRFTAPARLWFRFMDAAGTANEATAAVSPVCGYLMPNHLDSALEVFATDGSGLGTIRADDSGAVVWEDAPGRPATVGQAPARAIANDYLRGVADGLLDWGLADAASRSEQEGVLDALLRVIDSTLWSIDPFGHAGDEHIALLLGHPIVVMRALLRLEIREPLVVNNPAAADLVKFLGVPVRLGALTHWQDGLLGYFVNDDYQHLYCADAAAVFAREFGANRGFLQQINLVPQFYAAFADDIKSGSASGKSPVTHKYVDASGVFFIQPNQDINLTLLVEPHTVVHATAGYLPRKEIGMRREWVADGLARLAPTLRFGPVLVDPKTIRMPIPIDLRGTWSWDHRRDISNWQEDAVVNATTDALLGDGPPTAHEGWLKLTPPPPATTP